MTHKTKSVFHLLVLTISGGCLLFLTGCAMFAPRYPVTLTEVPEPALPAPQIFQAVQSVVFSFHGRDMTGIGALSIDREARSFELSCMTPMGTKLFDLQMKDGQPEVLFALPFFEEKEGFAEAVALDISRIYFDQVPPQYDEAYRKGDALLIDVYPNKTGIEYRYTGSPPYLNGKQYCGLKGWEVRLEYTRRIEQDGFNCIGDIHLKNRKYGYQLMIRTKELTIKK